MPVEGADQEEPDDARRLVNFSPLAKGLNTATGTARMVHWQVKRIFPASVDTDVGGRVTRSELFLLLEREDDGQIERGEARWRGNGGQIGGIFRV